MIKYINFIYCCQNNVAETNTNMHLTKKISFNKIRLLRKLLVTCCILHEVVSVLTAGAGMRAIARLSVILQLQGRCACIQLRDCLFQLHRLTWWLRQTKWTVTILQSYGATETKQINCDNLTFNAERKTMRQWMTERKRTYSLLSACKLVDSVRFILKEVSFQTLESDADEKTEILKAASS